MASDHLKLWAALSVICLVQAMTVDPPPPPPPPTTSCNFFDVVDDTPLGMNVLALKEEIITTVYSIGNFTLNFDGEFDRLPVVVTSIKKNGGETLFVINNLIESIVQMASDRTVPVKKLLELFEKPYKKLKKFFAEPFEAFINEVREHLGCTLALEVKSIARRILHQVNQIATIIDRLEDVVKDPCRRQKDMLQLVRVLSNRVQKITAVIVEAKALFGNAAMGIQQAEVLLRIVDGTRNTTIETLKSNRDTLRLTAKTIRDSALMEYISGLEAIKTNISDSIAKLVVFETSRKLSKLTKEFENSYVKAFKFLRDQNRTDITDIRQYYRRIVKNMEAAATKVTDKFLDAAFRTALKLVDIVLECGPDSDSCLAEFQLTVVTPFAELPELILGCTILEPPRWVSVVEAFNASVDLLNITYDQLAVNIASCANFTNFTIDSSQYLQAKACLKTNLEDMNNLVKILEPQFVVIDRAIELDVDVSKFRVENCLAGVLHNNTAKMKATRTQIERCAGRIDDCPRRNRDDDENDWYDRYNLKSGFVDESDEVVSSEKVKEQFFRNVSTSEDYGEEVSYEINSEEETVTEEKKVENVN